jgi:hypothetical protein
MNAAYIHLLTNHFPIIGLCFTVPIMVSSFIWKSQAIRRLSFALTVITALITIPAYNSGEGAEQLIKPLHRDHTALEMHEHSAEPAYWLIEAAGLLGLIGLATSLKKETSMPLFLLLLLVNSVATIQVANLSHLGGLISHPEINETSH